MGKTTVGALKMVISCHPAAVVALMSDNLRRYGGREGAMLVDS